MLAYLFLELFDAHVHETSENPRAELKGFALTLPQHAMPKTGSYLGMKRCKSQTKNTCIVLKILSCDTPQLNICENHFDIWIHYISCNLNTLRICGSIATPLALQYETQKGRQGSGPSGREANGVINVGQQHVIVVEHRQHFRLHGVPMSGAVPLELKKMSRCLGHGCSML